jgi:hypothetical protein
VVYWYQVEYYGWALYLPDIHCVYILDNGSRGRRTVGLGVALHIEAGVQDIVIKACVQGKSKLMRSRNFDPAVPVGHTYIA